MSATDYLIVFVLSSTVGRTSESKDQGRWAQKVAKSS